MVNSPPANAGDTGQGKFDPCLGKSPGGGDGSPIQCPCLDNPVDRGAWRAAMHRIANSQTQLSVHSRT